MGRGVCVRAGADHSIGIDGEALPCRPHKRDLNQPHLANHVPYHSSDTLLGTLLSVDHGRRNVECGAITAFGASATVASAGRRARTLCARHWHRDEQERPV
jgi:hypothetical protein